MCRVLTDPNANRVRVWDVKYKEQDTGIPNPVVEDYRRKHGKKPIDRLSVCEHCNDIFYRIWKDDVDHLTYIGDLHSEARNSTV